MSQASKNKIAQELTLFANSSPEELIEIMAQKNAALAELDRMKALVESEALKDSVRESRKQNRAKISDKTKYVPRV